MAEPDGVAFMTGSSNARGEAAIADGDDPAAARAAAERCADAYIGPPTNRWTRRQRNRRISADRGFFAVLSDPVRRRILELLAEGEQSSGAIVEVISDQFGIGQPAVSMHFKVLRDNDFVQVRADGARRVYAIAGASWQQVDGWLGRQIPHLLRSAAGCAGDRAHPW